MTRLRPPLSLWFLLAVVSATPAFGLWGRYPNDEPVKENGWPPPIVTAVNAHRRVYGAGGDSGTQFYFVGNTEDVNRFLAKVAEDKDTVLNVVLVPDAGTASVMSEPFGKDLKIDYSWSFDLQSYREKVRVEPKPGESQEQYDKRREKEVASLPEFSATVTVHCAGPIDPAGLKLPLRFNAGVGGRLAKLAEFHRQRREWLEKDQKHPTEGPPTDFAALDASGGRFVSPTTKPAEGDRQ